MKIKIPRRAIFRIMRLILLILCLGAATVGAADLRVRNSGFVFFINDVRFPNLTLVRGSTYTFDVQTSSSHPFHIESPGVDINDISSGVITYFVPTNNQKYYYECTVHGEQMRGMITTVAAPHIEILNLSVGTNLVLTSTATNNWKVYPEYTSGLGDTNWFALTVQSNRFINGARETICGRPDGDAVFIRIKSTP